MFHNRQKIALAGFSHVFRHVLNDTKLSSSSLKVHIGIGSQHKHRDVVVNEVAIPAEPETV